MNTLAKFEGGPLHGERMEIYGEPFIYRAEQYVGVSKREWLQGVLPSMPVQTEVVEYQRDDIDDDGAIVYKLRQT